jgi:hypothetical protein
VGELRLLRVRVRVRVGVRVGVKVKVRVGVRVRVPNSLWASFACWGQCWD